MFLKDLVSSVQRATERLEDAAPEDVVGFIQDALRLLTVRTGIKFTLSGTTWDTLEVTTPTIVQDTLQGIVILQAKQIANGNTSTTKTKVGPITVEYNLDAWDRDEKFLERAIEAYAFENGLELPTGYAIFTMDEYDLLLDQNINLNTVIKAIYGQTGI